MASQRTMQARMLAAMRPRERGGEPLRWQQQKSARTRLNLIEAGIGCLLDGGYAALTTAQVVERSGVSRGAMHHHFPARMDLVAAVIEHLFYERMRLFLDDYLAALARDGEHGVIEVATEAHWRSMLTREYEASLQLAVAARSDAELARLYDPIARRFDEVWTGEMIEAFPQWRDRWESMKLVSDFVNAAHLGLLLQGRVFGDSRVERVKQMVAGTVQSIYRK